MRLINSSITAGITGMALLTATLPALANPFPRLVIRGPNFAPHIVSDKSPQTARQDSMNTTRGPGLATYQVTIENLTSGQPFSPPVAATHKQSMHMFQEGGMASDALAAIAQDGKPMPMFMLFNKSKQVTQAVNAMKPLSPRGTQKMVMGKPVSDSATFMIKAAPGDRFSVSTMLICTNDGFTGLDAVKLPQSGSESFMLNSYDAGREKTTEKSADLVDPCTGLGPVPLPGDPNMNRDAEVATVPAEPIQPHQGIQGVGDLSVDRHGWDNPVAKVTITRMSAR